MGSINIVLPDNLKMLVNVIAIKLTPLRMAVLWGITRRRSAGCSLTLSLNGRDAALRRPRR